MVATRHYTQRMRKLPERQLWDEDEAFLSNFSLSELEFDAPGEPFNGFKVPTVEHAYQAAKTLDTEQRFEILTAETPGQAKRLGQDAELRSNWEQIKADVMRRHLQAKFSNESLARRLGEIEGRIVEWNTWHDTVWGRCICEEHDGAGQNMLGKLLMEIRGVIDSGPGDVETPSSDAGSRLR